MKNHNSPVHHLQILLSLGKLCKEHGFTFEWPSGREPRLAQNVKQTFKIENFVPLASRLTKGPQRIVPKELRLRNGWLTSQRTSKSYAHTAPQLFALSPLPVRSLYGTLWYLS